MQVNKARRASAACGWLMIFLGIVWAWSAWTPVFGQDESDSGDSKPAAKAVADDSAPDEEKVETESALVWLIKTSGLIGLLILIISIFFVHRVVMLFMEFRPEVVAPPELQEQLEALLAKRDFNGIYQAAKKSDCALGQLITSGLVAMSSGLNEAREAMDRIGEAVTVHMEKRISLLAVIGSLGPMIGLLGTLKGMIASFSVIARSGTQLKAGEVAEGISEALVLTFEGVFISVPAIFLFALFKDRVSTLTVDVQNTSDEFIRKVHAAANSRQPPAPT